MRLAVVFTAAAFLLGAGIWLLLRHETAAGLSVLLTVPLIAWRVARGGSCGRSCRRCRGDSDNLIVY